MKALINASIYDFTAYRDNCYILFDSEIEKIGPMEEFTGAMESYDCSGCIVMPGLVNCHTHIYSTFSRGIDIPFNPQNFRDILTQLWWKLDSRLDLDAIYYSGIAYGSDCIKNGVTTIIDHHASGLSIKGSLSNLKKTICDELGLRGIFCFETSDRFNTEECINENLEFCSNKTQKYTGLFGLHASMTLSDKTIKEVSCLSGTIPIHIHIAESRDDADDSYERYGVSIMQRLDRFNLLKPNSILAHCVHINEDDARLVKERDCYIAVNSTSNMNNSVGLGDYDLYRKNNIKCMIGNDGLGSNITRDYLNTVFGMRNRLGSPVRFNLSDLKDMINNGYEYINKILDIKAGRIEHGYAADMIVVPYVPPTPIDETNAMGHIFFGVFDNFHPRDVWVSGKCLMEDFKLNYDINGTLKLSQIEACKVWDRINNLNRGE